MIPWWLYLLAGAAVLRVAQWAYDAVRKPSPRRDAAPQPRGRHLLVVLRHASQEQPADISVAIERDRARWN
jgi:hypothetical protein